jgi:hypothetical protein
VCTLEGLDPSNRSCRCANNNRTICNQPFESDPACSTPSCKQADSTDLIGISCSTNSDCGPQLGRCNFDDTCACYFGPPLALSAGNTPACVVNRFSEDIVGTADVDLGQGEITTKLRSVVFTGEALTIPCPHCEGDVTPNDGVRDGVCVLGDNAGKTCDVDAVNTTFPAAEGGGHSLDCFPAFGRNVSGSGLRIELTQTTGSSELRKSGDVVCGFPPFLPKSCWCAQCSGDPSVSCTSTAECEAAGLGTCTSFGSGSRPPAPTACDEDKCVPIAGSAEFGECELGPTDKFCDGIVRASGVGYIGCQGDADCSVNNIGLDAGFCTLSVRRACFLDPIIVSGEPDPSTPIGATTFCIPPTANRAINEVAGLPGPARVRTQARSRLFCANDPDKEYVPGVGGCE